MFFLAKFPAIQGNKTWLISFNSFFRRDSDFCRVLKHDCLTLSAPLRQGLEIVWSPAWGTRNPPSPVVPSQNRRTSGPGDVFAPTILRKVTFHFGRALSDLPVITFTLGTLEVGLTAYFVWVVFSFCFSFFVFLNTPIKICLANSPLWNRLDFLFLWHVRKDNCRYNDCSSVSTPEGFKSRRAHCFQSHRMRAHETVHGLLVLFKKKTNGCKQMVRQRCTTRALVDLDV